MITRVNPPPKREARFTFGAENRNEYVVNGQHVVRDCRATLSSDTLVVVLGVGWNLHVIAQSKASPPPQAPAAKSATAPKVGPVAPPATDAEKINSALAAAPAAISGDATALLPVT